jgi:NAD+ kinase
MKFGLVVNTNRPHALKAALALTQWLRARDVEYVMDSEAAKVLREPNKTTLTTLHETVDVILSLGGDGTLLRAARFANSKPVLGVNLGRLGFLAEFTLDELYPAIERILKKKFVIDTRTQLEAVVIRGRQEKRYIALNDVIVERGGYPRMPRISLRIDGHLLSDYRADGIIIATSTGSTAYSMSAGGPIIVPKSKVIVITPICPHMLTVRPIVVSDDKELEISAATTDDDNYMLNCDGSAQVTLTPKHRVVVRKAKASVHLIANDRRNYYDVLRQKFFWGKDYEK